jgi:hypothetical protein
VKTPKWVETKKGGRMAEQKQETQNEKTMNRGLAFIPFVKVRKAKNNSLLIFITDKVCVSVNIKYLLKVLENQGEE